MGGSLSVLCFLFWLYIVTVEIRNVVYGNDGELSSITAKNNIAENQELVQLHQYGIRNDSIKVGVNVKNVADFDN